MEWLKTHRRRPTAKPRAVRIIQNHRGEALGPQDDAPPSGENEYVKDNFCVSDLDEDPQEDADYQPDVVSDDANYDSEGDDEAEEDTEGANDEAEDTQSIETGEDEDCAEEDDQRNMDGSGSSSFPPPDKICGTETSLISTPESDNTIKQIPSTPTNRVDSVESDSDTPLVARRRARSSAARSAQRPATSDSNSHNTALSPRPKRRRLVRRGEKEREVTPASLVSSEDEADRIQTRSRTKIRALHKELATKSPVFLNKRRHDFDIYSEASSAEAAAAERRAYFQELARRRNEVPRWDPQREREELIHPHIQSFGEDIRDYMDMSIRELRYQSVLLARRTAACQAALLEKEHIEEGKSKLIFK